MRVFPLPMMALLPIILLCTTPATVHFSHHDVIGGSSDPTTREISQTIEKFSSVPSRFIQAEVKILKSILCPSRYKSDVPNAAKPLNAPTSLNPQAISTYNTTVYLQGRTNRCQQSSTRQQTRQKEERKCSSPQFSSLCHKKQRDNGQENTITCSLTDQNNGNFILRTSPVSVKISIAKHSK